MRCNSNTTMTKNEEDKRKNKKKRSDGGVTEGLWNERKQGKPGISPHLLRNPV